MDLMFAFITLLMTIEITIATSHTPLVSIDAGTLKGGRCEGLPNTTFFKSIPYAQPPIGHLRFAPPRPFDRKYPGGMRVATHSSPSCIQFGEEFAVSGPTSEDCLYIDIWAPSYSSSTPLLPVKVWIYGGGEEGGGISDPLYDGCNVANNDALLVSINYRLGPLGFLALESAGIDGNQAIHDILLGLQWIRKNIAAFGGDPESMLLHGQSAGAVNTFIVATLKDISKLIKAAIVESGGGRDAPLNFTAQKLGRAYARTLNCKVNNANCLKSKSVADLQAAVANTALLNTGLGQDGAIGISNVNSYQFTPYVDGKLICTQPSAEGVQIPTIFGSNSEDGTLFALTQYATAPKGPASATAKDYEKFLEDNFGPAAALVKKYYPLSAFDDTPFPAFYAIETVITDAAYKCPAYRGLNRAVEKGIPVWTYIFSHTPTCPWLPAFPKRALKLAGATHTAEIPFVFGNTIDLPAPNGSCNFTSKEKALSATLVSAWTAMAGFQNPSGRDFNWPRYRDRSESSGININDVAAAGYVNYTACVLWDKVNEMFVANSTNP